MLFSSKKVVGIDLGSSSIKLAQVSKSKSGATLDHFAIIQTPAQSINNGDILDPFQVGEALKINHKNLKFTSKNACIGMWGATSIVKKIKIPRVEPKALKEQIKYEAQQYLPFDISQVAIDYHVLPFASTAEQLDVLIVAGQIELMTKYIEVVSYGNLKISIIDVNSLALANSFEFNYGKINEPIGLFNFGSTTTQFVVVFQGEVLFARDIPVGGTQLTYEISNSLSMTMEEAESLKLSSLKGGAVPENMKSAVTTAISQIIDEIKNSLDFYSASGGDFQLSRAFYTGGSSQTEGLIEALSQEIKMNFEAINPFLKVKAHKKYTPEYLNQIAPFISVSLGLGLREVGDS